MQYGFFFNSAACTGCKTCVVACKDENNLALGELFRKVLSYEEGDWSEAEGGRFVPSNLKAYHISLACNHCANPACVENCPTGAMAKDPETGIVINDKETCIGCKTCIASCPYSAPQYLEALGVTGKCDMCQHRLDAGQKPRCVTMCPVRALDFGDIEELKAKYGDTGCEFEPLPLDVTDASLVIAPHAAAVKSEQGAGEAVNFEHELGQLTA